MNLLQQGVLVLRDRGWCKGEYFGAAPNTTVDPGHGPCCVLGSIGYSTAKATREQELAVECLEDELFSRDYGNGLAVGMVSSWNDHTDRTLDEVIDVMEAAASRLDGRLGKTR